MRSLILISKIAARLGCKQIVYGLLKSLPIFSPRYNICHSFEEAVGFCQSIYKDDGGSCIRDYSVQNQCKKRYDLEIIVPVYNVERYVEECIESILAQKTRFTFHLTIVNDGSTDCSRDILKKYETFKNITIIDQDNEGFSGARNTGIRNANGTYLMFVDSDDRLPQGAIEALMSEAIENDCDIVQGGYERFDASGIINRHLPEGTLSGFAWGKVYKADVWNGIQFPERYWFEDTISALVINCGVVRKSTVEQVVYDWRKNLNSISFKSVGRPKVLDTIYVTLKLLEDRARLGLPENKDFKEALILQLKINARRIYSLNNKELDYANYVISRYIFDKYIRNDLAVLQDNISKALLTNNYKHFILASCFL